MVSARPKPNLEQPRKFINGESCLANDGPERAAVELGVVWDGHLGEWFSAAHDDVTSLLADNPETDFVQRRDALPAGDAPEFAHTARTMA